MTLVSQACNTLKQTTPLHCGRRVDQVWLLELDQDRAAHDASDIKLDLHMPPTSGSSESLMDAIDAPDGTSPPGMVA